MIKINKEINEIISYLQSIKTGLESTITHYPGSLKTCHSPKSDKYYFCENGNQKYLRKEDLDIARTLSQQEYDQKLIPMLGEIIELAARLAPLLQKEPWQVILDQLPPAKRALVKMPVQTAEELVKEWFDRPYSIHEQRPGELLNQSLRGDFYRSKSESTIADYLDENHLAYIYEREFILDTGFRFFPDFTIYMPQTDREIIWEHFGMMDSPEYAEHAITKINQYEANGLLPGVNLFYTFESVQCPLSKNAVKRIISRIIRDNT